jgi:hypothetical protein
VAGGPLVFRRQEPNELVTKCRLREQHYFQTTLSNQSEWNAMIVHYDYHRHTSDGSWDMFFILVLHEY